MLNYIWPAIIIFSFIVAAFTGNMDATMKAAFEGAGAAITTVISLLGIMGLWTGLMNIAQKSGMVKIFSRIISPINRILFPKLDRNSPAFEAISMNMVANMLGLANAATPLGLKAMQELKKLSRHGVSASKDMCMFVVINSASIQIIPSTLIGIRSSMGSANPAEIILPVWIVSITAAIIGVTAVKICQRKEGR